MKILRALKLSLRNLKEIFFPPHREGVEHYDRLISPEVFEDDFFELLSATASRFDVKTLLEIGSSSGEGSTRALINGISSRLDSTDVTLHCMEISLPRFQHLSTIYSGYPFVTFHRLSSVGLTSFPKLKEIKHFYRKYNSILNHYTFAEITSWFEKDVDFLKLNSSDLLASNGLDGIDFIMNKYSIHAFDFVLIDGGEFVGWAEYKKIYGAKIIALDDVNSFKCRYAYDDLANDVNYRIIGENWNVRNGWAIFEKI